MRRLAVLGLLLLALVGGADGQGFYRTRKDADGRWWAVDPSGRDTMLIGADHVRHAGWWCEATGRIPYREAVLRQFGTREAWETNTLSRLQRWGFNMLGVGSDETLRHRGLVYAEILHLGDAFVGSDNDPTRDICPNPTRIPSTAFPNVFHPKFAEFCRERARRMCSPLKADPDLVGYFTDNELCWWGLCGGPATGLFDTVAGFAESHPARQALERLVAERGGRRDLETKRAFLRLCAKRYFETTAAAVREADPNHMILGCRFANLEGAADTCVWDEAGKVCDVVSFNCYCWADLDRNVLFHNGQAGAPRIRQMWDEAHAAAGKPLLVTEWSFPALDAGLPCSNGAGQRMRTQKERAAASGLFARSLLSSPYMLGYVYFMWLDQPKEGITRAFPENSNYGLVTQENEPHRELIRALAAVQRDSAKAHRAPYPPERAYTPPPEVTAADACRAFVAGAARKGEVAFVREGDAFRLADGSGLELAGTVGGDAIPAVLWGGRPVGRFTGMLRVNDEGTDWIDATKVTAANWKPSANRRSGTLTLRLEGGRSSSHFELTLALTVAAGRGRFLCELLGVKNLGEQPLSVESFYFREYPDFKPMAEQEPPADWVWKGVPGAKWRSEDGLVYGGMSRSGAVRRFRYFLVREAALPDAEFLLEDARPFAPGESRRGNGRVWMEAFVQDGATGAGN